MKNPILQKVLFGIVSLMVFASCERNDETETQKLEFKSSDKKLEAAFRWAKGKAYFYQGDSADPVGPWYEAALPEREAFCMRDMAHMCIGAQMLGMENENKNMLLKFAENISKSKDWCTYWEINRYNRPAPADYRNDKEFWYNLPANFDVVFAALQLYKFTGDSSFVLNPLVLNFMDKSMNEYVGHWDLGPSKIMSRERFMHLPEPFNPNDAFHVCRGLPSYVESMPELKLGADLIAAEYAAFLAASEIELMQRNFDKAQYYLEQALDLKIIFNSKWWDQENERFNTFLYSDDTYRHGEGEAFLLRYGIIGTRAKVESTVASLLLKSGEMNIETRSYLPMLLFENGFDREGYQQILKLTAAETPRRNYPEVSFTVVESIVSGLMGIRADAKENQVFTMSHLSDTTEAAIENLEILGQRISVVQKGKTATEFQNSGTSELALEAAFQGNHSIIVVNGKARKANLEHGPGYDISYVQLIVKPGEEYAISIEE